MYLCPTVRCVQVRTVLTVLISEMVCTSAGMLCGEGMTLFVLFDSWIQLIKRYLGILLARLHIIVFFAIFKKTEIAFIENV